MATAACVMRPRAPPRPPTRIIADDVELLRDRELCQGLAAGASAVMLAAAKLKGARASGRAFAATRCIEEQAAASKRVAELLALALVRLDEEDSARVVEQLLLAEAPRMLVACLEVLEFEAKKVATHVLGTVIKRAAKEEDKRQVVEHIRARPELTRQLLEGCCNPEVFFHCAYLVRYYTRSPELVTELLSAGALARFVDLAQHQNFDIASEAFGSLRALLLTQKTVVAPYLEANFLQFFRLYNTLLQQDSDYVVQRQASRLLGEVMLDRSFKAVMMAYVKNAEFLQTIMNLLRSDSSTIQLEAFHVFKVFVANPRMPAPVEKILCRNRDRLIKLLRSLRGKQREDEGFAQDLEAVLGLLRDMRGK